MRARGPRAAVINVRLRTAHWVELQLESDTRLPDSDDEPIDELDTVLAALVAGLPAELGRCDAGVAGEAVDPACLPIAGVAGIDDDDAMQIAPKPERCRQPCGPAADYGYVIGIAHAPLGRHDQCQMRGKWDAG